MPTNNSNFRNQRRQPDSRQDVRPGDREARGILENARVRVKQSICNFLDRIGVLSQMKHTPMKHQNENSSNSNMYPTICLAFCFIFFDFLVGVAMLGIITPDREKSESENRMLRQFPAMTVDTLTDGSYMRDLETYMTDQFPNRDELVKDKTYIDMLSGKQKIKGVFLGSDSYLFDKQSVVNENDLRTKADAIKRFCSLRSDVKCSVAIVPNSIYVLADKLPYGAPVYDQSECIDQIKKRIVAAPSVSKSNIIWTDCLSSLTKLSDYQKYYRTDHHWTTRSAYEVFKEVASDLSLDTSVVNYEFMKVTDSFQGTLASSSGLHHISDTIEICYPKDFSGNYVIEYEAEQTKRTSFFFSEKLAGGNQYEVFMGGNFGKIVITSQASKKNSLLLIKDSYANCVIPMLAPYFSKIVIIDPRYLNDDLTDVMQDNSFTHMLFLYNLNTFIQDNSLVDAINIRLATGESASD